ncbi:MAG TPA: hypothetical protein VGL18_16940 [Actinomycetota bacterium]
MLITMPVGGYGYSGWVREAGHGGLVLEQGPKLLSLETSIAERREAPGGGGSRREARRQRLT